MMDLTPAAATNLVLIEKYNQQQLINQEQRYDFPLLVTPEKIYLLPQVNLDLEEILQESEVILVGTELARSLYQEPQWLEGLAYEIMSVAAACRTYNILALEGRKVIAYLTESTI